MASGTALVKPVRSNMPPSVKAKVISRYAQGKKKTHISRELKVSRPTIDVILKEAKIDQFLQTGETLCAELIPNAVDSMKANLKQNNLDAAKFILQPVWNSERLSQSQSKRMQSDPLLQQALNVLVRPQVNVTVNTKQNENTVTVNSDSSNETIDAQCATRDETISEERRAILVDSKKAK